MDLQTNRGPLDVRALRARPLKGVPSHEAYKNWPILNGMISKDGPNFNNGSRGSSEPNGQNTIGSKLKPLEGKKSGEKSDEISFGLVKILKGQNANDSVGIVLDEGSIKRYSRKPLTTNGTKSSWASLLSRLMKVHFLIFLLK